MAERGKRQDPKDPAAQRREKRRRRAIDEENAAQEDKRFTVLRLLRAVVVAAGVVAAGDAHRAHCNQERQPIFEPKRLPCAQHEADLDQRHGWRRSYRMTRATMAFSRGSSPPWMVCSSRSRLRVRKKTASVIAYYSGSKSAYGINVQAMCTADNRFCAMSAISPGSTKDSVAWNRSSLAKAVARLPAGFDIIGDAAYPIGEKVLTPYPGRQLPAGEDSFNFHLSQLCVKIEQSFGILWRPLRVQLAGRADLITALSHLHNFLQVENVAPIQLSEEDSRSGINQPALCATQRTLPDGWGTEPPSRSGETPARAATRKALELKKQ
ncbi:unnamed protein product [Ectocarpus sp. CCAP 1310/34]|nr:unnamed protein product [Ectocarpus sp. CCAP 1310/34]